VWSRNQKRQGAIIWLCKIDIGLSAVGASDVTDESSVRPVFKALDRYKVPDVGLLVTVELDRDTDDFSHLVGQKIVIDGKLETCFSVERFSHMPPWKQGQRVSLLIRKES
jgi:hypothetical protein